MAKSPTKAILLLSLAGLLIAPRPWLTAGVDVIFQDGFEVPDPTITSAPITSGRVDEFYTYDVNASDPTDLTLLYLLTNSPAGMKINVVSGVITWTPNTVGNYPVAIDVSNGQGGSATQNWMITVESPLDSDNDGLSDPREVLQETDPDDPDSDDDGLKDGEEVDVYSTNPTDADTDSDGLQDGEEVSNYGTLPANPDTDNDLYGDGMEIIAGTDPLNPNDFPTGPPDPVVIAPPIDSSVTTTVFEATEFLYAGSPPIQTGVQEGAIDPMRAAVLRGLVMSRDGSPLAGATITILDHPEYGQTISRADGMYDMVVNGGGPLTIDFVATGYLPGQRLVQVEWQTYTPVPDLALVQLDSQVTAVDLASVVDFQVAQGSLMTDADGSRQATVLFPQGTTAMMRLPDDSMVPVSDLSVRATEYTVGENGPAAMPGELPANSAYTYAVELSIDEAILAGAETVEFNSPIPYYVNNFLGFPSGTPVPSGFYDREMGSWVASDNGLVIDIIDEVGGLAILDTDDSGTPADPGELAALGITDAERTQMAILYQPGDSLWRVPISHFSAWDSNWGFYPPFDAEPPWQTGNHRGPEDEQVEQCIDNTLGSIIECQNQVLGESIPLTGTRSSLNYRSDRVPGNRTASTVKLSLSGDSVPASLDGIEVEVNVAGKTRKFNYPPNAHQSKSFTWDGKDVYGRKLQGGQPMEAIISYRYEGVYYEVERFGYRGNGTEIVGSKLRREVLLSERYHTLLTPWSAQGVGLGGWNLDQHHAYDVNARILYRGDGSKVTTRPLGRVISTLAGTGDGGFSGDGGPANQAQVRRVYGVLGAPDGTVYIADSENHRVRHIDLNGIITTVAGTGTEGYNGDNIPATSADLIFPRGLEIGPDGSLYFSEDGGARIRKVDAAGIISTVVGTGIQGFSGDGGPATSARIYSVLQLAFGPDGDLYFADAGNERVRRVDSAGIITTVAGTGTAGYNGDNQLAINAQLYIPTGVAVDAQGNLYIGDAQNYRVRRVGSDGMISTFAGTGISGFNGGGLPAAEALLGYPKWIDFDAQGNLYIVDDFNQRIRIVRPDGILSTIAGSGPVGENIIVTSGDGGIATEGRIARPESLSVGHDGRVIVAGFMGRRVRVIEPPMRGFGATDVLVASADAAELYRFDNSGRHLQTINTLSGAVLEEFSYTPEGTLSQIEDAYGNVTTVQRNGQGNPVAIVGPFGQTTALAVNGNGFLNTITNPQGEQLRLESSIGGLIGQTIDPRGRVSNYGYASLGRLASNADNAAYSQSFVRTAGESGFEVSRTTGLGRTVNYDITKGPNTVGGQDITAPDGSHFVIQNGPTLASRSTTSATGTVTNVLNRPDPRFSMQAPALKSITIATPGGPVFTASSDSQAILSNPADPLSLISLSSTATIDGRTSDSDYEAASRTRVVTSPEGRVSTLVYDPLGRVISAQFADLAPMTISYNPAGEVETMSIGMGEGSRTTTMTYGADGLRQTVTDSIGRTASFERDDAGRVIRAVLPDSAFIDFSYNHAGDLSAITPPDKPQHNFEYSLFGKLDKNAPPLATNAGPTLFTYNLDRQPVSIAGAGDEKVVISYDAAGRTNSIELREGGLIKATHTMSYLAANQLDTILGPGAQTVSYDFVGDLVSGVTWAGIVEGGFTRTYDNAFRQANDLVNGGSAVGYDYDDDDLLTNAGDFVIVRDANNGLAQSATLGIVGDSWSYNNFGEVTGNTVLANAVPVYNVSYVRDDLGRITQMVETVEGVTDTYDYDYDLRGQLIEVQKNNLVIESYSYDDNGNRTGATVGGDVVVATYDAQDRLLTYGSNSYTYSPAGRLASRTEADVLVTNYDHDVLGNLRGVSLPDGTHITYGLDGPNHRVERSVNGTITQRWLYDGILPIAELDALGNVISQFVYAGGNAPAYMIRAGVNYRLVSDHLGTVRLVVNSATGVIAQRINYDSFGRVTSDTNPGFQPLGFAGGLYDPATGLVRFGVRDFDGATGRWTAQDPAGFVGGGTNLYSYVLNDPVNRIDPWGLGCFSLWDAISERFISTNEFIPGLFAPTGLGLLTAGTVGNNLGSHTLLSAARLLFNTATGSLTTVGSLEIAAIYSAAGTAVVNTVLLSVAFEGGAAIGSLIGGLIDWQVEATWGRSDVDCDENAEGCPNSF